MFASFLAYTHTGYNTTYGGLHAKIYYHEDDLCASVIRHLRTVGSHTDPDKINTMLLYACTGVFTIIIISGQLPSEIWGVILLDPDMNVHLP